MTPFKCYSKINFSFRFLNLFIVFLNGKILMKSLHKVTIRIHAHTDMFALSYVW